MHWIDSLHHFIIITKYFIMERKKLNHVEQKAKKFAKAVEKVQSILSKYGGYEKELYRQYNLFTVTKYSQYKFAVYSGSVCPCTQIEE